MCNDKEFVSLKYSFKMYAQEISFQRFVLISLLR